MTCGFDVFVHDVIAAITTAPCVSSKSSPSSETRTVRGRGGARDGDRGLLGLRMAAGACSVVGSLAGNVSARAPFSSGSMPNVPSASRNDCLRARERHAVLRPARPRERRLDVGEVEPHDLRVHGLLVRVVPEEVLLAVRLDERDPLLAPACQAEVVEGRVVDREEAARRAVLGRHVPDRRAVGDREAGEPAAEVLDELADDARRAQDLGHGQDQVGGRRALAQLARELEADDLRDEHRQRLAEHRRLGLDPADAPAEHARAR